MVLRNSQGRTFVVVRVLLVVIVSSLSPIIYRGLYPKKSEAKWIEMDCIFVSFNMICLVIAFGRVEDPR